jgi:hypothetical protein
MIVNSSASAEPPAPRADDWRGSYSEGMFESRSELSRGLDVTELIGPDGVAAALLSLLNAEGLWRSDAAARAHAGA